MPYVDGALGESIEKIMNESNMEFNNNNFVNSIRLLEEAWELLPGEKVNYSESYLIVYGILKISILIEDKERMSNWVEKIFVCAPQRGDTGERELWAGKVAYETGEFEKAKEYLDTAYIKSKGRCFSSKDSKYLKYIKKR